MGLKHLLKIFWWVLIAIRRECRLFCWVYKGLPWSGWIGSPTLGHVHHFLTNHIRYLLLQESLKGPSSFPAQDLCTCFPSPWVICLHPHTFCPTFSHSTSSSLNITSLGLLGHRTNLCLILSDTAELFQDGCTILPCSQQGIRVPVLHILVNTGYCWLFKISTFDWLNRLWLWFWVVFY